MKFSNNRIHHNSWNIRPGYRNLNSSCAFLLSFFPHTTYIPDTTDKMAPSLNLQREPFFQFGSGIQALESRIKILENDVKERELQNAKLQEDLGEKDELISQLREQIEDNKGAFDLQDLAVTQLQGQVEDREEELEKQ
jgi:hypothetical protein